MEAWYNIWVAGVDVFTTCIQQGITGGVYELGLWPPISLATSYLAASLQYFTRNFKVRILIFFSRHEYFLASMMASTKADLNF